MQVLESYLPPTAGKAILAILVHYTDPSDRQSHITFASSPGRMGIHGEFPLDKKRDSDIENISQDQSHWD